MDNLFLKERLKRIKFKCIRCSTCCRFYPGAVFLTEDDFYNITNFLSIDKKEFLNNFCRGIYRDLTEVVALKEKDNYDCIFWENGCKIYSVRPIQCKTYPFWSYVVDSDENFTFEKTRCKGIGLEDSLKLEEKLEYYLQHKNIKYMEYK